MASRIRAKPLPRCSMSLRVARDWATGRGFLVVEDGLAVLKQERITGNELGDGGTFVLQLFLN